MQNFSYDLPMLITLLDEEGSLDDFLRDSFQFDIICAHNFEIEDILFNPLKSVEEKLAWIDEMLIIYFSDTYLGFLRQLARNDDLLYYEKIIRRFLELLSRMRNCHYAKVTTTVPLREDQRDRITIKLVELFGKQVFVYNKVSRYFSGGLLVECGDKMIDLGLWTGLDQLKRTLNAS